MCEVDLDRLPVTIGRSPGNDVVLDDPIKSVSREHAQIRREGERYVLVDHKSENGIWLAGRRLPSIPFGPETVASIGPFRLRIEGLPAEPRRTPVPSTVVPPPPAPPANTASKGGAAGPDAMTRVRGALAGITPLQWKIAAGAIAASLLVAGGIWAGVVLPARERARVETLSASAITTADEQITRGLCADALGQTIQPALVRDPGNAQLQALKQKAEVCLAPATTTIPREDPNILEVTWIQTQLALRICNAEVVTRVGALLEKGPDNTDYQALKAEVEKCRATATAGPAPPKFAVRVPPDQGGLEPLDKELDKDYQTRVRATRQKYDAAVSAAKARVSRESVRELEAVAGEVPAGYLELDASLAAARTALTAATTRLLTEGRELVAQMRWNEAQAKFNEATELDPDLRLESDFKRLQDGKIKQGEDFCDRARKLGNFPARISDAQDLFRKGIALLPPQHQCHVEARKILDPQ